jgi:hypothetical protein
VALRNHRLAANDAVSTLTGSWRPASAELTQQDAVNSKAKPTRLQGAALLFFVAMAVLHSWPLASDPVHLSRLDNHDAELNTWIVAWVAHILPRAPLSLFEATIMHPEQHSLAFSEHMFVPSVMGAPLLWLGASPVLVYNLLIMAGLALSGWAMYLLMARWTGSISAGLIAGLLYAFNAHVLTRFVHLQAQHVEFFPLMLYALDRVLVDRRPRHAVLLAAAFVLQSLCSNHLLVFSAYALIVAVAVRWRELHLRTWQLLVAAGALSVVALLPFLWPYYQVDQAHSLARDVNVVTQYNAGWRDYLVTGGRLHFAWWSHVFYEGRTALFPGITAIVLAGIALLSGSAIRDPRARMALAFGVLGVALSFGTSLPGYPFLHQTLPLVSGLRNVARWGWLALAAFAILAGFGAAYLERLMPRKRWIPVALGALVTIEAIRTPVGFTRFQGIPAFYDRLAGETSLVLAEFPFYSGASVSQNGPYVLANTRYFRPLLNGYSSFHPESFEARGRVLNTFPSGAALAELRAANVTHVTVHLGAFARHHGEQALEAIDTIADLERVSEEDGIRLYRLR